jgi:hypothetical protein
MRKNKYTIQQQVAAVSTDDKKNKDKPKVSMAFNIFQVYQYFTIYRRYFVLKFEYFHILSYTTIFKIWRYQILLVF